MQKHRWLIVWAVALLLLLPACDGGDTGGDAVSLSFYGPSTGRELDLTNAALRRFNQANPDIQAHVSPTPRLYQERLDLYNEVLQGGDPGVDLLQIDVVWTKALAVHALDLKPYVSSDQLGRYFATIVENNTADGKLVGIPWFTDAPLLYYRSDLLAEYGYDHPPGDWDELEEMASAIQKGEREKGNLGFWGYAWQGRPYEGLTCNALEWQASQGGGNILDEQGNPSFNNAEAAAAFQRAAGWIGTISPPQVTDWDEEDAMALWRRGDVAFMRNWSFGYSETKKTNLGDDFEVTSLPAGPGGTAPVLGGWQLMVSKYSRHPEAAARLARFLASEAEQKIRAVEGSQNPTINSLYGDTEILKAMPFAANFDSTMNDVVRRPSTIAGTKYPQVSEAYWTAVHTILTGGDAQQALAEGEARVKEILSE